MRRTLIRQAYVPIASMNIVWPRCPSTRARSSSRCSPRNLKSRGWLKTLTLMAWRRSPGSSLKALAVDFLAAEADQSSRIKTGMKIIRIRFRPWQTSSSRAESLSMSYRKIGEGAMKVGLNCRAVTSKFNIIPKRRTETITGLSSKCPRLIIIRRCMDFAPLPPPRAKTVHSPHQAPKMTRLVSLSLAQNLSRYRTWMWRRMTQYQLKVNRDTSTGEASVIKTSTWKERWYLILLWRTHSRASTFARNPNRQTTSELFCWIRTRKPCKMTIMGRIAS